MLSFLLPRTINSEVDAWSKEHEVVLAGDQATSGQSAKLYENTRRQETPRKENYDG
jgi:hypothetical protein